MIWIGLGLVLLGAAIWPFRKERQRSRMDDAARSKAPGQFAKLAGGLTHYTWSGPETGPVLVCIHGLTTPSFVWFGLTPFLTALGYRVLTYDLFGRGYSDRPRGLQDRGFFMRQLDELLANQNVTGPVTVVGYSMGGAISACFASANPNKVKHLILLTPAGLRLPELGWRAKLGLRKGIGDWLMLLSYPAIHLKGTELERDLPTSVKDIVDLQQQELKYQGFTPAVLSSFRGLLSENLTTDHETIARGGIPTLCILGEKDDLIPPEVGEALTRLNPSAHVVIIKDAGHGLPYTHTKQTASLIEDFLASDSE